MALTRSASPRLWAYAALGAAGLLAAVGTGRAELAVAVTPVLLVALAGVVLAEGPDLDIRLRLEADRVLEGTSLSGAVLIAGALPHARIDVVVPAVGPLAVSEPPAGRLAWMSWGGGADRELAFTSMATRWGIVRFDPVWVRAFGPLGLVRWQGPVGERRSVRVLPSAANLGLLLPHPDPRATSGAHLARRPGDGIEFADARPYQPGDRLRSMNWALSTRRGELWVNERRPERMADLVVLVDTFADDATDASLALGRSARAAWLLAQAHLEAHDRVGLITFGGYPAWVTPGSGERARYELLDKLLATTAAWTEAQRSVQILPRQAVPAGASLVAVSPLYDQRFVSALVELRRRGLSVAAVRVDASDLLPARPQASWDAAVRLFHLELERRERLLDDAGVPTVAWPAGLDAGAVLLALREVARAPVLRHGA